jgi:hypothetical protein
MVKTAIDPAGETAASARLAIEISSQTRGPRDIENEISKGEKVVPMITDDATSQEQAGILASYAESLFLRWNATHQLSDIQAIVTNLVHALEMLPHASMKARYHFMIRLAKAHESWYLSFKDNSYPLITAIRYWEDAYGLSAILRQMKEAVGPFALADSRVPYQFTYIFRRMKSFQASPMHTSSPSRMRYLASNPYIRRFIIIRLSLLTLCPKCILSSEWSLEGSTWS